MSRPLEEFCARFVAPLLSGAEVRVATPVRPSDLRAMAGDIGSLLPLNRQGVAVRLG